MEFHLELHAEPSMQTIEVGLTGHNRQKAPIFAPWHLHILGPGGRVVDGPEWGINAAGPQNVESRFAPFPIDPSQSEPALPERWGVSDVVVRLPDSSSGYTQPDAVLRQCKLKDERVTWRKVLRGYKADRAMPRTAAAAPPGR